MKTIGQIAYEAYCAFTGWKSAHSGQPLPQWVSVKHEIKMAWQHAGNAVKVTAERLWPDLGPNPLRESEKVKPGIEGVLERTAEPVALQQAEVPDQTGLFWRADVAKLRDEVIWRTAAMAPRSMTFAQFSEVNERRCREAFGHPIEDWTPSDWAVAAAGELGEAMNLIKKLRRLDGSLARFNQLSDRPVEQQELIPKIGKELGDTFAYMDLLAKRLNLDLGICIRDRFNEISDRSQTQIKLP